MKNQREKSKTNIILISGGDPAGIAPEIIERLIPDMGTSCASVLYFSTSGGSDLKRFYNAAKKNRVPFHKISLAEYLELLKSGGILKAVSENKNTVVDVSTLDIFHDWSPGKPGKGSGLLAFEALRLSCDFILQYGCRGLLTAPLSKEWVAKGINSHFSGHTEYLAMRFDSDVLMLMHGRKFSVIPLTVHIPIRDVSDELKKTVLSDRCLRLLSLASKLKVFSGKKWALCGINPHCGDGGYLGGDEIDYLNKAAERWRGEGIPVDGPLSADGVFMENNLKNYRLILSAYHDQGLIPFKALEGNSGINVTIGLPFIRTSPDHGTAFSIAGKKKADPESLKNAFRILCSRDFLRAE